MKKAAGPASLLLSILHGASAISTPSLVPHNANVEGTLTHTVVSQHVVSKRRVPERNENIAFKSQFLAVKGLLKIGMKK